MHSTNVWEFFLLNIGVNIVNWIRNEKELVSYCSQLSPNDAISIDTESDHMRSYRPQTCVIQICVDGEVSFVDALEFDPQGMAALSEICADPRYEKLLHSASNDIREMNRDYGSKFSNVFDTQVAMQFLGYSKSGLAFLLEEFEGLKISKKYQRYNWRTRPIHPAAIDYAANDVLYLEACRDRLLDALESEGWLEAFQQQCEWICDDTQYVAKPFKAEGWRKIKATKKLPDDQSRSTIQSLFEWRHKACSEVDRAALHLFDNETMIRVATRQPRNISELRKIRGMNHVFKRYHKGILEAVNAAKGTGIPKRLPAKGEQPGQPYFERFEALRTWRNEKTEEIDIPAPLILTNALIQELAKALPEDISVFDEASEFLDWKHDAFKNEIIEVVKTLHS